MKLDPKVRSKLESGRLDDVDEMWMSRLEESPDDMDFYTPVVRALLQRAEQVRASMLVQLWLEAQRDTSPARQLANIRTVLAEWPDSPELRAAFIGALRQRYGDRTSFDMLATHFGIESAADQEHALRGMEPWLQYDVGRLVAMAKLGVGRVAKINLALSTLRVDFDDTSESFRLAEAQQLLEPLEADHFLVVKRERRAELERLVDEDPGELLHLLFASLGSPLPVATVRDNLRDLVPARSWTGWWKRARNDGRLTAGSGAGATCTWSESADAAHDQLLEMFDRASDTEKLHLVRQHADRSDEARHALMLGLSRLLRKGSTAPDVALEAALQLDELHDASDGKKDFEFGSWNAAGTKAHLEDQLGGDDAAERIARLADRRARERAMAIACAKRGDARALLGELLRLESDARTISVVYERLRAQDMEGLLDTTIRDTLYAPERAPRFYVWLCREMARRDELKAYMDWRFLRALLDSCDAPALKSQRAALRELFDPGGLAVLCVDKLDATQCESLLRILERDIGVEEYRKDNVRRAVLERFPELAKRDEAEEPLYVTPESLERKRAEFERIVRVEIPRNTEEIRKAAAHGDLRENFEYKSARERQEMLSSRAQTMHEELRRARALDPDSIDASVVRVGTRLRLEPTSNGEARTLTILGPWDSDPSAGILSYLAPAVGELLGKKTGEAVRFADSEYTIASIEVWNR